MKYLEMTDEDRRRQEQRRATRPVVRRGARTAVAGAGVLTAVVLGWCSVAGVGLTTAGHVPAEGLAQAPSAESDWAEPAMRRTLSVPARPARPTAQPPAAGTGAPAVAATTVRPMPQPQPRPRLAPSPAASPSVAAASPAAVRKGDACPAAGATGVTRTGAAMVCTASPGNGRTRWRAA